MALSRRLSAILVADMVGFSALSQRDEPEAVRLALAYQEFLRTLLPGAHGREIKTMGDGMLVEFDSALEATQCAIDLQRELTARNRDGRAPGLQVRVGIHVGDVLHRERDVYGDTVNIAARIEPLAEGAGVAISGAVFDQVSTKIPFRCTRLEHAFLKNIDTPLAVYALDLPWHAPPAARLTPFTDRLTEKEAIGRAVTEAARGRGGLIGIAGESGIGKTRLAEEAIAQAERAGFRILRARGFENVLSGSYGHWVEIAGAVLRGAPDPLVYKLCDQCAREVTGLLPELSDRVGPLPPAPVLPSGEARLRFFGGVGRFVQNIARQGPVLLLFDDLQWADVGSVQLLGYLAPQLTTLPALAVLTYRDAELDPNGPVRGLLLELRLHGHLKEIPLARFDAEKTRELLDAALGTPRLAGDLAEPVLEKTGGNPLFVEEVVRSLVEEGHLARTETGWDRAPGLRVEIPSTVREVIHRRVARIGPAAEHVLAVASVLGNEFDFATLQQVSGIEAETLLPLVEAALRTRLLHEREVAPGRSSFRLEDEHVREVLYSSLSLTRRRQLHARAAETLERLLGARATERSGEIARHYLLGDRIARSVELFTRAADRARELFSFDEAMAAYAQAAELFDRALAGGEELGSLRGLGVRIFQGRGDVEFDSGRYEAAAASYRRAGEILDPEDHAARARNFRFLVATAEAQNDYPGVLRVLDEADRELAAEQADPKPEGWRATWLELAVARFNAYYWLSDTGRREELLAKIRPIVERSGRPDELARLHSMLGSHGFRRDNTITDESFRHYRDGWAFAEQARTSRGLPAEGEEYSFERGFVAYWHGDFAEARLRLAKALAFAESRHHARLISRALTYSMLLARRTGDVAETARLIPLARKAAEDAGLPEYGAMALANQAWVDWRNGDDRQVGARGERALETWRGLPERYMVDWLALWPMIAVARARGESDRALRLAGELLTTTQEPPPRRLRELVETALRREKEGDRVAADAAIDRAIEVARATGYL